jgi:hypothetical protein
LIYPDYGVPDSEAMPTPSNTGPRIGLTDIIGDYHITTDDVTISGKHITGDVWVNADNVTLVDCQIDGALYPSNLGELSGGPNKVGLYVSYCDIFGVYTYGFDTIEFTRCRFGPNDNDFVDVACGDNPGVHAYFDYCLWDRLLDSTGDKHIDASQILGPDDVRYRHCVFDFAVPSATVMDQMSFCLTWESAFLDCTPDGWEISDCEFYGGGYFQVKPIGPNGKLLRNKFHTTAVNSQNGYTHPTITQEPMYGYPGYPYEDSGNTRDGVPWTGPTS